MAFIPSGCVISPIELTSYGRLAPGAPRRSIHQRAGCPSAVSQHGHSRLHHHSGISVQYVITKSDHPWQLSTPGEKNAGLRLSD